MKKNCTGERLAVLCDDARSAAANEVDVGWAKDVGVEVHLVFLLQVNTEQVNLARPEHP